jgi:peptidyl-prolyl cis-trans isomerase B (cyclophilin B)
MEILMLKKSILIAMFSLLSVVSISAQNKPAEQPTKQSDEKTVKKTNQRPKDTSPQEKFDNADVKTMASQCVKLETEQGNIEMEMFPESAPETVRNFLNLTALGIYDTTTFSRVVPDFIVQGGNIATRETRTNEMTSRAYRSIPDEPNLIKHERGIVSMARGDEPNSASSNFFILLSNGSHLDGSFAAFGRVTKGMEVVEEISKLTVENEKPEKPVRIKTATVFTCASQVGK